MENATKALLIAAGVLVGIILISLIMVTHRGISNYYATKENAAKFEQLSDFNKQYIPYDRDDVRGTDLISLVNKIIDFNNLKDGEKIEIDIKILNEDGEAETFFYDYQTYYEGTTRIKLIKFGEIYSQDNINSKLIVPANAIEGIYTQGMATKLAANISTLMGEYTRKEPEDLFIELKIDPSSYGGTTKIQEDILKYYQYQQFKRAHFNCKTLTYTTEGRVKKFTFEFNGKFE